MTGIVRTQLTGLARTLAELKERVRAAVAGELGRAVSGAVEQVIQTVLAGQTDSPRSASRHASSNRWDDDDHASRWDRPHDPWDNDTDGAYEPNGRPDASPAPEVGAAAAVAAGVYAARWWLVRRGTRLAAVGLGLGVGLLGVLGGPVVRTAVAVLAAIGDILSATDALGDGASRLDHP